MESWRKYLKEEKSSSKIALKLAEIEKRIKLEKEKIRDLEKPSDRIKKIQKKREKLLDKLDDVNTVKACGEEQQRATYDKYLDWMLKIGAMKPDIVDKFRDDLTFGGMFDREGDCIEYIFAQQVRRSDWGKKQAPVKGAVYYPSISMWYATPHPFWTPGKVSNLDRRLARKRKQEGAPGIGKSYLDSVPSEMQKLLLIVSGHAKVGTDIINSATGARKPYSLQDFRAIAMAGVAHIAGKAERSWFVRKGIEAMFGKNWYQDCAAVVTAGCDWAWSVLTGNLEDNKHTNSIAKHVLEKTSRYIFREFNKIQTEIEDNYFTAAKIFLDDEVEDTFKELMNILKNRGLSGTTVILVGREFDKLDRIFSKKYSKLTKTINSIRNLKRLALLVYRVSKLE